MVTIMPPHQRTASSDQTSARPRTQQHLGRRRPRVAHRRKRWGATLSVVTQTRQMPSVQRQARDSGSLSPSRRDKQFAQLPPSRPGNDETLRVHTQSHNVNRLRVYPRAMSTSRHLSSWCASDMVAVGPPRCLPRIRSHSPARGSNGSMPSGRCRRMTMSASCS